MSLRWRASKPQPKPEPQPATEPSGAPSEAAKRWWQTVVGPPRCDECGFLTDRGRCAMCDEGKR